MFIVQIGCAREDQIHAYGLERFTLSGIRSGWNENGLQKWVPLAHPFNPGASNGYQTRTIGSGRLHRGVERQKRRIQLPLGQVLNTS